MLLGNCVLKLFDIFIDELDDLAGLQAHHMIVVVALGQLEHGMAAVEVQAADQPGAFKLGKHPVDRGQPHIFTRLQQRLVNILRAQVVGMGGLQYLQDLHPWQGYFQTGFSQFLIFHSHRGSLFAFRFLTLTGYMYHGRLFWRR